MIEQFIYLETMLLPLIKTLILSLKDHFHVYSVRVMVSVIAPWLGKSMKKFIKV